MRKIIFFMIVIVSIPFFCCGCGSAKHLHHTSFDSVKVYNYNSECDFNVDFQK